MRAFVQRIQQPAHLRVGKADRRKITAHRTAPFVVLHHPLVPCLADATVAGRRHIGKIVLFDLRQKHFGFRVQREIFLRRIPGDVRAENTYRLKEWL